MAAPAIPGLLTPGNIDLGARPIVRNRDGSISTVRSMSFEDDDGTETLIPTVADDGSRILSDDEAVAQYQRTGKHLGKFADPATATAYARRLHDDQAKQYLPKAAGAGSKPVARPSFADPLDDYYGKQTGTLPATGAGFPAQRDAAMATGKARILAAGAAPTPGAREARLAPDAPPAAAPAMSPYEEGMAAINRDVSNLGGMAANAAGSVGQAAKDWYANGGPLGGYTRDWWNTGSLRGKSPSAVSSAQAATPERVAQPPADDAPDLPPLTDRAAGRDTDSPVMPASEIASRLGAPADQVASLSSPVPEDRDGTAVPPKGTQPTFGPPQPSSARTPPVPVAKPVRRPAAKPAPASGEPQPGAPLPPITTPTAQVGATGPRSLFSANLPTPRPVAQPAPPTFGESRNLLSWLAASRDPAPAQARPDVPQPWRMMNER